MISHDVIIVGAGAAGMFAAAVCAERAPGQSILVLERQSEPLGKVRISGGGRCNLTHACTDIRTFAQNYPRGSSELIGPFHQFGPTETMEWFEAHDVPLVTLEDGCVFPQSDRSESVIDALQTAAENGHLETVFRATVVSVSRLHSTGTDGDWSGFQVEVADGRQFVCRKLLIATGGGALIDGLDHTIEPCVPSLFTFKTSDSAFTALAGIVEDEVRLSAPGLRAEGTLLITHGGISGPAALRLSSFGARVLAEDHYCFAMKINWLPSSSEQEVFEQMESFRAASPRKQVGTWSPMGLSVRLWKLLVCRAGVDPHRAWGDCPLKALRHIAAQVSGFELPITGKNPHREEFVTCGGIRLKEVNFKTMESRLHPGLFFAGEILDIDALTGGFNLQAAWTTGYIAAQQLG
ncbi:MAG: NAD(P)/FAD-dependent oxidoreductase [Verrucomicrobia bacterium]|jgi:predicted Rossmann fold flavoprotein|nr:NAD(P)/FAD-dependent oxidoreductase [Verrucomicrobiota bacterium]